MSSNSLSSSLSATEESLPHFLQTSALTEESEEQLRNEVRKPKPLQEEGLRATEESEELLATSEKIENQNVSDCVKFIRTTIYSKIKTERSNGSIMVWGTCSP
jgi:transcriptional antiterminator